MQKLPKKKQKKKEKKTKKSKCFGQDNVNSKPIPANSIIIHRLTLILGPFTVQERASTLILGVTLVILNFSFGPLKIRDNKRDAMKV